MSEATLTEQGTLADPVTVAAVDLARERAAAAQARADKLENAARALPTLEAELAAQQTRVAEQEDVLRQMRADLVTIRRALHAAMTLLGYPVRQRKQGAA